MNEYNLINIAVISVFAIIVSFFGVWSSKRLSKKSYIASGGHLDGISTGLTIGASKIGFGVFVIFIDLIIVFGFDALWVIAGYVIGFFVFYIFALHIYDEIKENGYNTMSDYFAYHYGKEVGFLVGILVTISFAGWIVINFAAGAKVINYVSGLPMWVGAFFVAICIAPYVIMKGFYSVVKTDRIQCIAILTIVALVAYVFYSKSMFSLEHLENTKSMSTGKVLSFFLSSILFPMGGAEFWQRVYATKNKKEFLKGTVVASITFIIIFIFIGIISLSLRDLFVSNNNMDMAVITGVANVLPEWLSYLWGVAIFLAIVSSLDTCLYTAASSFIPDVLNKCIPKRKQNDIKYMQIAIFIFCIYGILTTGIMKNSLDFMYFFVGITISLGVFALFSWFSKKLHYRIVLLALVGGAVSSLLHILIIGSSKDSTIINMIVTLIILLVGTGILKVKSVIIGFSNRLQEKGNILK